MRSETSAENQVRAVRLAISRLHKHLAAATDGGCQPPPGLAPVRGPPGEAFHHPAARFNGRMGARTRAGVAGRFIDEPPARVIWSDGAFSDTPVFFCGHFGSGGPLSPELPPWLTEYQRFHLVSRGPCGGLLWRRRIRIHFPGKEMPRDRRLDDSSPRPHPYRQEEAVLRREQPATHRGIAYRRPQTISMI